MRKVLVLPVLLGACVAPSQQSLNQAIMDCNYGNTYACQAVPQLNAQVQSENYSNNVAAGVGAVAVGGALIGLAASESGGRRGYYRGGYGYRRW